MGRASVAAAIVDEQPVGAVALGAAVAPGANVRRRSAWAFSCS